MGQGDERGGGPACHFSVIIDMGVNFLWLMKVLELGVSALDLGYTLGT